MFLSNFQQQFMNSKTILYDILKQYFYGILTIFLRNFCKVSVHRTFVAML